MICYFYKVSADKASADLLLVALLGRLHGVTKARTPILLLEGRIRLLNVLEPRRGPTALGLTRRLTGTT